MCLKSPFYTVPAVKTGVIVWHLPGHFVLLKEVPPESINYVVWKDETPKPIIHVMVGGYLKHQLFQLDEPPMGVFKRRLP
jgi:hypothetical protein